MRIFIYISDLGAGGAERVCVNLANELTEMSHEVHIITLNLNQDVYSQLLNSKVKIHSLEVERIRYAIGPIVKLLKHEKAEKVLAFGNEMGSILVGLNSIGIISCKVFIRVLNNIEINISREEKISFLVRMLIKHNRKLLCKADCVVAQCYSMEKMLQEQLQLGGKCRTIYNPVSQFLVQNAKPVERTEGETKKIGFIGRLDPQKNVMDLLQAFELLLEMEDKVTLHFFGKGIHEEKAREFVEKQGIDAKVFFEGVHSDMEKVYSDLDMVVLSSNYEGMPNALIEAIAIGIPVVSYDCPIGPSEIIVDDVNGYLIPMSDVKGLAEGMKKCLRKEWDIQAIQETAAKFDVKKIAKEYESVLMEA